MAVAAKKKAKGDDVSIRGKDTRLELAEDLRDKAEIMAKARSYASVQAYLVDLCERAIAGEWHGYKVALERAERSGALRKIADERGRGFGA